MLSDQAIIQRCLEGHSDDYRCLVDRHAGAVRAFARQRLVTEADVDEAAAETFARGFFLLARLREPAALQSWLLGIAERILMERRRRPKMNPFQLNRTLDVPAPAATEADPELHRAINSLPDGPRQIVLLRFFKGMTCRHISSHLDEPVGTVTKQLSRAYALLRQALAHDKNSELHRRTSHDVPRVSRTDCRA